MKTKINAGFLSKPIVVFVSFLFIILIVTGCGRFEVETSVEPVSQSTEAPATVTPTSTPTSVPTPTPTATQPAAIEVTSASNTTTLNATFRDTYTGLALDYPGDWEVIELSDEQKAQSTTYATIFQSWVSGPTGDFLPAGGGNIPEGGTKIDLAVSPDGALTLEVAIEQRRALLQSPASDTTILSEMPVTLASGLEGVFMTTESNFGEAEQFVTVINGHLVIFSGLGDEALIDQILQTLRPRGEADVVFEPYPTYPTDVQAIRIADGVEMAPIYSGPGETFPQITALQSGLALAVSGITKDASWYQLAGCGEQNPFRPAPSCWISSAQSVVQPIQGLEPSHQAVLETEKQAVLVVAQDMAAIHNGPDITYPIVAQLAGGFGFNIVGVSEDGNWWRLVECSSPLNELMSECWISADPSITQALDEPILHGAQPSADSTLRAGTITITELPKCFNLDMGTVGTDSNPNCEFNLRPSESAGTLVFEPIQPARFGFSGVFPEVPNQAMCVGSQHLHGNTEVIAPAAALYVCYQTGEGRFGYLHFLQMTDEPLTVTLEWQTFGE